MQAGGRVERVCVALGTLLLAGGLTAVGLALLSQDDPARPVGSAGAPGPSATSTPAATPTAGSSPTPTVTPTPGAVGVVLPRSEPVALDIPAIGVRSDVFPIGLNADGTIAVPEQGPRYDSPAWYRYSPTPGQRGPSVIEGHLDSPTGAPSVFYRLGELRPGQEIGVDRADGLTAMFRVTSVQQYAKAEFPTSAVYGDLTYAGLRLITCAGGLDSVTRHYLDNTVVFAEFVSAHPTARPPSPTLD